MSKKRRNSDYEYFLRTYGPAGTGGQNRPAVGPGAVSGQGSEQPSGPAGTPASELEMIESTEPVVGYRQWQLCEVYPVGYQLVSSQGGVVWPTYKKMTARCLGGGDPYMRSFITSIYASNVPQFYEDRHPPHDTPDPTGKCYCGINAWNDGVPIQRNETPIVVGSVNMWGRVIEYKEGYRAEFAYPKELAVVGKGDGLDRIATSLELAYGVPCRVWV